MDVGSDHHFVTAFIKLKQRSAGHRMTAQRHFDTEKLQDPRVKITFVLHVKNRCVMSAFFFNLVIDRMMRHTTEDQPRGIRWTLFDTLEDLDFTDNLALLSHTYQHMQEKTCHLSKFGQQVGL